MESQDHQVEIWRYVRELTETLDAVNNYDWINEQLELKIWRSDDGWKAEILITFGGPNVSIELDSRYRNYHTLWHSWGANANGETQTVTEFYSRALHDAVSDIVEMGAE